MPRSRDRHARGIRGPLVGPGALRARSGLASRPSRADFFADCVTAALADVERRCPAALVGLRIAVDDVPPVSASTDAVPLALAVEARADQPAHVVLFRRPLERRASSRAVLRTLVHRMVVEQLTVLTGRSVIELAGREFDDD